MTMAAAPCTCRVGPLASLFPPRPCPRHGEVGDRAEKQVERLLAERDRLRDALTTIANNNGFIPLGGIEEFAASALASKDGRDD